MIACRAISKTYGQGTLATRVLDDVHLAIKPGEACVLLGPSGSGKTTLLSILGCLLTPTSGELYFDDVRLDTRNRGELSQVRRRSIGFVFQHSQLLPFLSVADNLRAVARNSGVERGCLDRRLSEATARLGIDGLLRRRPSELSGGQRQRVAIARALLHEPRVVLADEPTAALDWPTGLAAVELLIEQTRRANAALIAVTHDQRLVPLFDRVLDIDSGKVQERN